MPQETRSELRVRYAETDQMGVVYHANYLVWCEIGRTDFIRANGRAYAELEQDGVRLAVSDAALRYHGSARYDDAILVYTRLVDVRSRSITFAYRIREAVEDRLLVSATTSLISLDSEGRLLAMPPDMRALLAAAVSPEFDSAR